MNDELMALAELLEQQKTVFNEMLDLSYKKRQVIVSGAIDELNGIASLEMKCVAKLKLMEKRRGSLLPKLSVVFGIPADRITVSDLIARSGGDVRARLVKLQKELSVLLDSQAEVNRVNQELLQDQLDYTEVRLNLFVGSEDPLNNLYDGDGNSDSESRTSAGYFDRQI